MNAKGRGAAEDAFRTPSVGMRIKWYFASSTEVLKIMSYRNDLPRRHRSHDTGDAAKLAFENAIATTFFVVQSSDRSDYGTDIQLEARDGDSMTNLRVHVQLKGTEAKSNADGSISVAVDVENLNYLLAQPDAIYAIYHLPSQRLLARYVSSVYRELEDRRPAWRDQKTVTIRCSEEYNEAFQRKLYDRMIANGASGRERRSVWLITPPEQYPALVQLSVPNIEVPPEPTRAKSMLVNLLEAGEDAVISAHFPHFAAVLQTEPGTMDFAYMAEINKGLQGAAFDKNRVRKGIDVLEEAIARRQIHPGSIRYCQANGWMVLGEFEKAREVYLTALPLLGDPRTRDIAAQCHKNLGTVFEELQDRISAIEHFEKALELNPELGEAHYALALDDLHYKNDPKAALAHLDSVIPRRGSANATPGLQGWRIEALFRLGDFTAAFRELQNLMSVADRFLWIWPSCARQVSLHGYSTTDSTRKSLSFWRSYLIAHPNDSLAERHRLLCIWSLHRDGVSCGMDFQEFKSATLSLIDRDDPDPAFLRDRIGRWAQRENNWNEAEQSFRKAYEIEPEEYGYSLGQSLNLLGRYAEALPILVAQAEIHKPDAMSWFQVATARERVGDIDGSISAYEQAILLDPEYDLAYFNLGGLFWNRRDIGQAMLIWKVAVSRFPNLTVQNLTSPPRVPCPASPFSPLHSSSLRRCCLRSSSCCSTPTFNFTKEGRGQL